MGDLKVEGVGVMLSLSRDKAMYDDINDGEMVDGAAVPMLTRRIYYF